MEWVGIFQVGIFLVEIYRVENFPGVIFLEPYLDLFRK